MFRPRVIPVLLLKELGLVKSIKFDNHRYIGDPINAVKIYNDKKADELVFLDIDATREKRHISIDFVRRVGDEANMPFAVGGGIRTIKDIRNILQYGAEKVILGTIAHDNAGFIKTAVEAFGSSTIVVCLDIKKNMLGKYQLVFKNATIKSKEDPIAFAQMLEDFGAGELIVQSVDRDGTYSGYDLALIKSIASAITIPVVALGGAKDYSDFGLAVHDAFASAVAAGSLFCFHGPRKAVLITFPSSLEIRNLFNRS